MGGAAAIRVGGHSCRCHSLAAGQRCRPPAEARHIYLPPSHSPPFQWWPRRACKSQAARLLAVASVPRTGIPRRPGGVAIRVGGLPRWRPLSAAAGLLGAPYLPASDPFASIPMVAQADSPFVSAASRSCRWPLPRVGLAARRRRRWRAGGGAGDVAEYQCGAGAPPDQGAGGGHAAAWPGEGLRAPPARRVQGDRCKRAGWREGASAGVGAGPWWWRSWTVGLRGPAEQTGLGLTARGETLLLDSFRSLVLGLFAPDDQLPEGFVPASLGAAGQCS